MASSRPKPLGGSHFLLLFPGYVQRTLCSEVWGVKPMDPACQPGTPALTKKPMTVELSPRGLGLYLLQQLALL